MLSRRTDLCRRCANGGRITQPSRHSAVTHVWCSVNNMISKLRRYREIVTVLARHGIGIVGDEFIKHEPGDRARAAHLRRACEELGTMFIKLGQVLSTRGDLLPEAYRAELAKLQDEVAPLSQDVITAVIREDLGASPNTIFASFDPKPLGSASIGQVHAARLADGRDVVLKVRKPGVDELVRIDLEILAGLVDSWSSRLPVLEEDRRTRPGSGVQRCTPGGARLRSRGGTCTVLPRPVLEGTRIQESPR